MRKLIITSFILFTTTLLFAQSYTDSLKAVFDNLPTSYYPSNLLHNRSPLYQWSADPNYLASPYNYPGTVPAPLIEKGWYTSLFNDMWHSSVNPALVPDAGTFQTRDSLARLACEVPISAMHLNFHRIEPFATDSGYLWYDTSSKKLEIMPDTLWLDKPNGIYKYNPNPDSLARLAFSEHEVFAGALSNSAIYKQGSSFSITFGLMSALFVSNQTNQITSIEMDFDNGQGFLPISFDIPKTVTYNISPSLETYVHTLRLRLHYDAKVVETRMPLTIVPNTQPADTVFYASNLPLNCNINANGFTPDQAKISIRYGNAAHKLLKPVFLIEGFESSTRDYGDITFEALNRGLITNALGDEIFTQAKLLSSAFDSLVSLGYDIVYIDNRNGRDYIQANALNAIKTIQWINNEVAANGSYEKLVVIGASMGGLVARYALSKMEADGCCHNTRLYCTFDSPHNGAHIPLGLQAAVKHLRDELSFIDKVFFDSQKVTPNWDDVLNSPGARQMLAVHYDPTAINDRNAFMAEYDSLGHPKFCRRVALVNGSEQALTNTLTDADKRYFESDFTVPLPSYHFPGISWGVILLNLPGTPIPFHLLTLNAFAESHANGVIFERNDIDLATYLAASIGLTHGIGYAVQVIAKALSYIPFFGAACNPVILASQIIASSMLSKLHLANLIFQTTTAVAAPSGMPNYSEAPGSLNNTPTTIASSLNDLGLNIVTLITPTHSFIPSISALDLDTNNLTWSIYTNTDLVLKKSPFDTYWAPGRQGENSDLNMLHIAVTHENYRWLIEQIDLNDKLRNSSTGSYNMALSGYYNFGRPADIFKPFLKQLNSVSIDNQGTLYINKQDVIGYPGDPYMPRQGSVFHCYTGAPCEGSYVTVKNGGLFQLGENSNAGIMHFSEGSTLEIKSGGTLRISKFSKLFIEEGAELIIHPGAIVQLQGTDAVLNISGKLTLKQNAVFQPTGTGFVRFDIQPVNAGWEDYLNFETNSQLVFSGTGMSDRKVEIAKSLTIPHTLDSTIFSNCKIVMALGTLLSIRGSLSATGSHFTSINSSNRATGTALYGQQHVHIANCRFSHLDEGLDANLLMYGHPITISNSEFDHNTIGLQTIGKKYTLHSCNFNNNTKGIYAVNMDGISKITYCDFENNSAGINAIGQIGSELKIGNCDFDNCYEAITISGSILHSWCSNYSDGDLAINISSGDLLMGKPEGHNNYFSNNRMDIMFNEIEKLKLKNGNNGFSGWYRQLVGNFSGTAAPYLHQNPTGGYDLDVLNNDMPGSNGFVPVSMDFNGQPVGLYNWSPPIPSTTAPSSCQVLTFGSVVCCGTTTINIGQLPLDSAVKVALPLISEGTDLPDELQDMTALQMLKNIFHDIDQNDYCFAGSPGCESSLELTDFIVLKEAYDYYLMALSNAYRFGMIELNRANPLGEEHELLSFIISETDRRLIEEVPYLPGSDELTFQYNLSKVHAYRMGEHYDQALNLLYNEELWTTDEAMNSAAYWKCVCEAERELIMGNISPESFSDITYNCQTNSLNKTSVQYPDYSGYRIDTIALSPNKTEITLAPNPSIGFSAIHFSNSINSNGTLTINSADGKLIDKKNIKIGLSEMPLNYELKPGLYLVHIETNSINKTLKWLIK